MMCPNVAAGLCRMDGGVEYAVLRLGCALPPKPALIGNPLAEADACSGSLIVPEFALPLHHS